MDVSDFDFDLPPELIAQQAAPRGTSRLLVLARAGGQLTDATVGDLPRLLRAGDLLVLNDTRVFPARLLGHRVPSGGAVECFLIGRETDRPGTAGEGEIWTALVQPGQKLKPGGRAAFGDTLQLEILDRLFFGRRRVRLWTSDGSPVEAAVERLGHIPLPPYIHRPDTVEDRERYQTIYASHRGSIAAPTAGLHFDHPLLAALDQAGIERTAVTLHVGYGTFKPVRVDRVEDHAVEAEQYDISPAAAEAIARARGAGRRIIAVGTTTTRALEDSARRHGGVVAAGRATAEIFIYPGVELQVMSGLVTNFHLPRSSLLMLVSGFAGRERLLDAYRHAVAQRYRFYSYGDAMLVL